MAVETDNHLVWLDLEMTGLDPEKEVIIEIATVVTDSDLNTVAEGPVIAVKQPQTYLDNMDAWNTDTHTRSGLVDRVKSSAIDTAEAEVQTLAFLGQYVKSGSSPMCGNSIGQDRRFLVKYMPALEAFFHYRNLDVSTIKLLAKRWKPQLSKFPKKCNHQALDDVYESINELKYYREHFFQQ